MKYKIAYLDEDEGWINTFYQYFKTEFEILRFKVDINSSIEELLVQLISSNPDAIVTDYLLEAEGNVSFNGNKIIEAIKQTRPHFPLIMLTAHQNQAISFTDDVHIIYSKDILDGENEDELEIFKTKIKANISNYYKKINETNERVENLVKKRNTHGLNINEEEELTKLYILFDELIPEGKDLPANLIHRDSMSKLTEFVIQTKEILEELRKLNKKK